MGHLLFTTRCTDHGSPHVSAIKQPTLAESFNHCVPYEKKGSRWTAVTDAVTLHIAKDMLLVFTVETPEVHPHAENVRPQTCFTKPQWGMMSQARGSRQARCYINTWSIPIWKRIFFYNSKQSDMLNLCLQKHFIKKGTQSFQKDALFYVSSKQCF